MLIPTHWSAWQQTCGNYGVMSLKKLKNAAVKHESQGEENKRDTDGTVISLFTADFSQRRVSSGSKMLAQLYKLTFTNS